jgi:NADP-dependent 3-hydroxy acid dehydrogenase YdfG
MLNGTRKFGQIVSVSSISGHRVCPACAAYSGTKFAVPGFNRTHYSGLEVSIFVWVDP